MRVALIGDVGGHRELLERSLTSLGASPAEGTLPDDLVVVQLGDLVDRGPDSAGCVAVADRFLAGGSGRWIQLLGNHEGNRLGGPRFWDEDIGAQAEQTLQSWWAQRRAGMAVAIRCAELGDVLVSHGGLVPRLWEILGRPASHQAAGVLNSWVGSRPELAFAAGELLTGHGGGFCGPAWASAGTELYGAWADAPFVPFSQVHGHSSVCAWPSGRLLSTVGRVRWVAVVDTEHRRVQVALGDRTFTGIDPCLSDVPGGASISALVLHGEIVAAHR